MESEFLTLADMASLINVSTMTVRRYFAAGHLPMPKKIGGRLRWTRRAVNEWLAAGCPSADELEASKETV